MKTAEFAKLLGITERRVRQMLDEGLLVTRGRSIQAIPSLVKLLGAAKERSKARIGRDRLIEAQVAAAGIRADRLVRKFMTIEEFSALMLGVIEPLAEIAQAESSLLFSEISNEYGEAIALQCAGRVHRRVLNLFNGARDGIHKLTRDVLQDFVNSQTRIDEVLAKYFPRTQVDDDDQGDEGEGEGRTEGGAESTTDQRATKPRRRTRPSAASRVSGPALDATVKAKR